MSTSKTDHERTAFYIYGLDIDPESKARLREGTVAGIWEHYSGVFFPDLEKKLLFASGGYAHEEALTDALTDLPRLSEIERLVEKLRPKELRVVAKGVLADCTEAVRSREPQLECATTINDWIATMEEMTANRRSQRVILAARDKVDARMQAKLES